MKTNTTPFTMDHVHEYLGSLQMPKPETTILSVDDILKRLDSFIEHNDVGTIFPENFFISIKHWFEIAGPDIWTLAKERDELLLALRGVVRVADRKTVEFDAARAAIAKSGGKP